MDYRNYSVEDFILDARFRKWVLKPDPEINLFWENWLARHPHRWKDLIEARKLLLNLSTYEHEISSKEKQNLWAGISKQIDEEAQPQEKPTIPIHSESVLQRYEESHSSTQSYWWLKIAAIVVFTLGGVLLLDLNNSTQTDQAQPIVMTKKSTEWGVKSHITLKDGTHVVLNAGSTLSYPEDFKERKVYLQGEAYFEVVKDPSRPFTVHSGNTLTTVLGTTFNISAYPEHAEINIALLEGKVKVEKENKNDGEAESGLFLQAGEMATYQSQQAQFNKSTFNTKAMTAWTQGILYFQQASEREVFSRLEKWYGVEIEADSSPKPWSYSAEFEKESLENVLFAMSYSMNFTYRIQDAKVKIEYQK